MTSFLVELFHSPAEPPPLGLVEPLVVLLGSTGDSAAASALIDVLSKPAGQGGKHAAWQLAAARGLLEGAGRSQHPIDLAREPRLHGLMQAARELARDQSAPQADRILAVNLLQHDAATVEDDLTLLVDLLSPQVPIAVSRAAIVALGRLAIPQLPDRLLAGWKNHSPAIRSAVVDLLLSRKAWTKSLLSAIDAARVAPGEINPTQRLELLAHRDPETRKRAQVAFSHVEQSRQKVVEAYQPALSMRGDPAAGKAVFTQVCAGCHRLGELGVEVGPNLGILTDKTPEPLLISILDPNRAFELRYANFTIATRDGRLVSGLIASETANAVTLRRQDGKEDVVLRTDIEEMTCSGQSLMPEGLEKELSLQDMANLIAFLEGVELPPKVFQGNHPHVVKPGFDGTILLHAADAEIRGDRLIFESNRGDLGYWMAANDRAAWKIEVPRPGKYSVWLDWACASDSAGNLLEIDLGKQRILFRVPATGTWDHYSRSVIGSLEAPAGTNRVEIRPAAPPRNSLLELRCIELRPIKSTARVSAVVPGRATGPGPHARP